MTTHYKEGHPLSRNPKGWFAVELSHSLRPGDVKPVSVVGRDLVLFRTTDGEVGVLDAYCSHLGTHLGYGGQVDGELLRCPFHHWGFKPNGRCADIPYSRRIPARADLPSLSVLERNGAILAWFDPDDGKPEWQIPEFSSADWSETRWLELKYAMHIQEFAENGVDLAHFPVVHASNRAGVQILDSIGTPFHFKLQTAYPGDGIGLPGQYVNVDTEWFYYGVSVFLSVSTAEDFGTQVRHVFYFTPLPGEDVLLRIGFSANLTTMPAEMIEEVQARNLQLLKKNFEEDRIIWKYKQYLTRPALCEGDGPFGVLRRWTRQFYPVSPVVRDDAITAPPLDRMEAVAAISGGVEGPVANGEEDTRSPAAHHLPAASDAVPASSVHDTIFRQLPASFNAEAAKGRDFVIQYDIHGDHGGAYFVTVRDGICTPSEGQYPAPSVTVSVNADDWLKINAGTLNRAKAFMTGRLKAKGDLALAYKLGDIFRA